MLEAELLRGGQPDIVIFYDGFNESSGHGDLNTKTPTHARADVFRTKLESKPAWSSLTIAQYKRRSLFLQIARMVSNTFGSSDKIQLELKVKSIPASVSLSNMMRIYSEGVAVSSELAKRHGFEVRHFWQPNLYTKLANPEEENAWGIAGYATWDNNWYQAIYRGARERLPQRVIDISDALDASTKPTMIDHVHTNELGARLVAERIFVEIRSLLQKLSNQQVSGQ